MEGRDQRKEGAMSVTDELLENAKGYAAGFDKGDLPLPPGKKVAVPGVQIDRFSGGKIIESWTLFDQLGMLQQLGAVPAPREPAAATR